MDGTWQIVKWVWAAICLVWVILQAFAFRRLKGDLKRRSLNVFWVVFVLMMISDWMQDVFEIPKASRIGMLAVGVAAIVAIVLLIGMLRKRNDGKKADEPDVDVQGHIRSLRLS